jgi:hypothetical protein
LIVLNKLLSSSAFCWSLYSWHIVCTEIRCVMVFGHSYVTTTVSHTEVVLFKFYSVLKASRELPKRKNLPFWTFLCFRKHTVAFCKCPWHFSRILFKT